MATQRPHKPRVFVDANVLFAGAASPSEHSASLAVLRLAEITLVEALTSEQVIVEAERNLAKKLPQALPAFRLLVSRCLRVVPDPQPADLLPHAGLADPKDLPILIAAVREHCPWLITFNVRHFSPGHPAVTVLRPGEFVLYVRDLLARLTVGGRRLGKKNDIGEKDAQNQKIGESTQEDEGEVRCHRNAYRCGLRRAPE